MSIAGRSDTQCNIYTSNQDALSYWHNDKIPIRALTESFYNNFLNDRQWVESYAPHLQRLCLSLAGLSEDAVRFLNACTLLDVLAIRLVTRKPRETREMHAAVRSSVLKVSPASPAFRY